MAKFFIERPIFAWVVALFIMVLGAVSITQLPISQYPTVAPPTIVVTVAYPGASAQTLEDSVLAVIEREMNGAPGLAYMEAVSQADGTGTLTLSFEPGTNPDLAQVEVQNRLSRATPRLPAVVNQQGVRVEKSQSNFLLFTMLSSSDPKFDVNSLSDYAARNVVPELQRLPGIGQVQLFGAERAMRIWIDPQKLIGFNLTPADVNAAISAQNAGDGMDFDVQYYGIYNAGDINMIFRGSCPKADSADYEVTPMALDPKPAREGCAWTARCTESGKIKDLKFLGSPEKVQRRKHLGQ